MANTLSAKKRVRQMIRKTEVNKARRSRIKTFIKRVETCLVNKDLIVLPFIGELKLKKLK